MSIYSNKACRLSYIFQGFKNASKVESNWGPALPENRTGRYADTLVDVAHSEKIEKNGVIAMDEKEKDLVEHYKMRRETNISVIWRSVLFTRKKPTDLLQVTKCCIEYTSP